MSQEKLTAYALRLILIKPRTEAEMRQKIKQKFAAATVDEIEAVIVQLKELRYLDDAKYIQDYTEYRTQISPRGKRLLAQELKQKGCASDLIKDELNNLELDEIALAQKLLEQKRRSLPEKLLRPQKEKLMRFFFSRGFSYDTIKQVLK